MVVTMESTIFSDVTLCSVVYQYFGGMYCLCLPGSGVKPASSNEKCCAFCLFVLLPNLIPISEDGDSTFPLNTSKHQTHYMASYPKR